MAQQTTKPGDKATEKNEGGQPKPSQAEGDEKTVDESIKQHEQKKDANS